VRAVRVRAPLVISVALLILASGVPAATTVSQEQAAAAGGEEAKCLKPPCFSVKQVAECEGQNCLEAREATGCRSAPCFRLAQVAKCAGANCFEVYVLPAGEGGAKPRVANPTKRHDGNGSANTSSRPLTARVVPKRPLKVHDLRQKNSCRASPCVEIKQGKKCKERICFEVVTVARCRGSGCFEIVRF
jgi:hypothetical protein